MVSPSLPLLLSSSQWDVFTIRFYSRGIPFPGLTAGRSDRPSVRPCIVSGCAGEEERLSSGEKVRIKAFLT